EDGIRVFHVTGVQTCALPISWATWTTTPPARSASGRRTRCTGTTNDRPLGGRAHPPLAAPARPHLRPAGRSGRRRPAAHAAVPRSEERRVGKECRYGWPR